MCGFLQPIGEGLLLPMWPAGLYAREEPVEQLDLRMHIRILLRVAMGEPVATIEQPVSGVKAERAIGFELLLATPLQLQIAGTTCAALSLQSLQFPDQSLDDADAALPEGGIARVEAEGGEQFGIVFGAAGRKHREIAFGEAIIGALVDRVQRVHQAVAERIGVNVERRVHEMRDVGPERLVARF